MLTVLNNKMSAELTDTIRDVCGKPPETERNARTRSVPSAICR
jgi:hypothetical protein